MYNQPLPFELKFNRISILSSVNDMIHCNIKNPETEYCMLLIDELLNRLSKEVPELKETIIEIRSKHNIECSI